MTIDIQFQDASDLLFEMLAAIPEERRERFAKRVTRVSEKLWHPPSADADVLVSLRSDDADKCTVAFRDVVHPVEGL